MKAVPKKRYLATFLEVLPLRILHRSFSAGTKRRIAQKTCIAPGIRNAIPKNQSCPHFFSPGPLTFWPVITGRGPAITGPGPLNCGVVWAAVRNPKGTLRDLLWLSKGIRPGCYRLSSQNYVFRCFLTSFPKDLDPHISEPRTHPAPKLSHANKSNSAMDE